MGSGLLLLGAGNSGNAANIPSSVHSSYSEKYTQSSISGMLAYWRLNETAGTTATAYPTTGYVGTYTGVTLNSTTAPGGGAAPSFDGVNDRVSLNTTFVDDNFLGTSGTITLWVSKSSANAARPITFFGATTAQLLFQIIATDNQFLWQRQAGGVTNTITSSGIEDFSTWTHIAATWDESDDTMKIFTGGTSRVSGSGLGAWTRTSLSSNYIGVSQTLGGDWQGHVAHVSLWDRTLTAAQIADLATTVV